VETTTVGRDFSILDAGGSGRMVSMVVDILGHEGSGASETYLEGDDRVYVDGSRSPSVYGTGTEDNFNAGFYYANGAFTLPTHGAGAPGSADPARATRSQYRVFGGDAVVWSSSAHYGMEHGAGDENVERVASTTFSYRAPPALTSADELAVGNAGSERAHSLQGTFSRRHLRAFFEGDRDGNLSLPSVPLAGAPNVVPPELSPESVAADGLAFSGPIAFVLRTRAPNCGVVLRRLLDAGGPAASDLDVVVDGRRAGRWLVAPTNPNKRWTEDDFEIPASLTRGRRSIRVTLAPRTSSPETMFRLAASARGHC
jgi:Protein of unknown function (DUF2961)